MGTLIQLSLVKQPWQLNLWRLSFSLASLLPRQATAMESLSTLDTEQATQTEAPRVFAMAVMEREMLSQATAMVVMVDMVPPLSLSPRPITDMATHSLTAMVTTSMVMEREMLRLRPVMDMELVMVLPPLLTIHMVVQAPPTEAPRDFLDTDMVATDTERDLLSPVTDMEADTLSSPKAVHTTMV